MLQLTIEGFFVHGLRLVDRLIDYGSEVEITFFLIVVGYHVGVHRLLSERFRGAAGRGAEIAIELSEFLPFPARRFGETDFHSVAEGLRVGRRMNGRRHRVNRIVEMCLISGVGRIATIRHICKLTLQSSHHSSVVHHYQADDRDHNDRAEYYQRRREAVASSAVLG